MRDVWAGRDARAVAALRKRSTGVTGKTIAIRHIWNIQNDRQVQSISSLV